MKMSELLQSIMEARDLTPAELTRLLGYQSKTSLMRVLRGQTNQRALDAMVKRLCDAIDLTDDERRQLDEAIEHMLWQDDYHSVREMVRFLKGERAETRAVSVEWTDSSRTADFATLYADARALRFTILNCQFISIFPAIQRYVRDCGAEVEHFLMLGDMPTGVLKAVNVLIPLLYEPRYRCYARRIDRTSEWLHAFGVLASDVLVAQYIDSDGAGREDLIVFDQPGHGYIQSNQANGGFLRLLGIPRDQYASVKRTYDDLPCMENYVRFCTDCAQLEYNRAVYVLKPDVSIDWIPVDILEAALQEGKAADLAQAPGQLERFREIFRARARNTFEKRKVARTILKRGAMLRFARTGQTMDHFWGMRPFTSEERVRILENLLRQIEDNPYFNVYILRDNAAISDVYVGYYEGVGVLLLDPRTDYTLTGGYSEVMITHPEFGRLFKEYFERVLLAREVLTFNETTAFLQRLIRIAGTDHDPDLV